MLCKCAVKHSDYTNTIHSEALSSNDPVATLIREAHEDLRLRMCVQRQILQRRRVEPRAQETAEQDFDSAYLIETDLFAMFSLVTFYFTVHNSKDTFVQAVVEGCLKLERDRLRGVVVDMSKITGSAGGRCTAVVKWMLRAMPGVLGTVVDTLEMLAMTTPGDTCTASIWEALQTAEFYVWYVNELLLVRVNEAPLQLIDREKKAALTRQLSEREQRLVGIRDAIRSQVQDVSDGRGTLFVWPPQTRTQANVRRLQLLRTLRQRVKVRRAQRGQPGGMPIFTEEEDPWDRALNRAVTVLGERAKLSLELCYPRPPVVPRAPVSVRAELLECMDKVTSTMCDWLFVEGKDDEGCAKVLQILETHAADEVRRDAEVDLLVWEKWSTHESVIGENGALNRMTSVVGVHTTDANRCAVVELVETVVCEWLNWYPFRTHDSCEKLLGAFERGFSADPTPGPSVEVTLHDGDSKTVVRLLGAALLEAARSGPTIDVE